MPSEISILMDNYWFLWQIVYIPVNYQNKTRNKDFHLFFSQSL